MIFRGNIRRLGRWRFLSTEENSVGGEMVGFDLLKEGDSEGQIGQGELEQKIKRREKESRW